MKNHTTLTALAASSILALSGCSFTLGTPTPPVFEGQASATASPSPSAPPQAPEQVEVQDSSPTPTLGQQTDAKSSADKIDAAFPERTMPIKNAEEYWQIMQKFDPGKGKFTAFPDPADPANYPLTDEEKTQVSQGEYVPATDKHPAFNYLVPEVPDALAKGGRAEEMGAEFLKYWTETYNYLMATGQTDELDPITEMPNKTMTGSMISDATKIYASGVWFEKCTYEANIAAGTKVVTLENQVHIYIPIDFKNSECRAHGGQSVSKDNSGSTPQVALIRYFPDTKKYVMFGFVEATGTYYDLPLAGKALVCSHAPTNCPQDTYDSLRSELKSSAAAKDGETTS